MRSGLPTAIPPESPPFPPGSVAVPVSGGAVGDVSVVDPQPVRHASTIVIPAAHMVALRCTASVIPVPFARMQIKKGSAQPETWLPNRFRS